MTGQFAKPEALIESYVADVMKRLPTRLRNDVGFELRALLREDLRGRSADAGGGGDCAAIVHGLLCAGRNCGPIEIAAILLCCAPLKCGAAP